MQTAPSNPWPRRFAFTAGIVAALAPLTLVLLLAIGLGRPHRRPPRPSGMVLRLELPDSDGLGFFFGVASHIEVRPRNGPPALQVDLAGRRPDDRLRASEVGPRRIVLAYPEGTRLEDRPGQWPLAEPPEAPLFDLDGDGRVDRLLVGREDGLSLGAVEVRSGVDGSILFVHHDPLEYEGDDRAFPLGDLDGDGYGELALVHPRIERSYDNDGLIDALLGVSSWVTVVSGAELFGPEQP